MKIVDVVKNYTEGSDVSVLKSARDEARNVLHSIATQYAAGTDLSDMDVFKEVENPLAQHVDWQEAYAKAEEYISKYETTQTELEQKSKEAMAQFLEAKPEPKAHQPVYDGYRNVNPLKDIENAVLQDKEMAQFFDTFSRTRTVKGAAYMELPVSGSDLSQAISYTLPIEPSDE